MSTGEEDKEKLFKASSLSNSARSSSTSSARSTSSVRLVFVVASSLLAVSSLILAVLAAIFKMSILPVLVFTFADTVVSLCRVKYDSRAWRFRAAAAAELTGNSAACCSEFIIAFCKERATFWIDLCKKFSCNIAVAKLSCVALISVGFGDISVLFSCRTVLSLDVCIILAFDKKKTDGSVRGRDKFRAFLDRLNTFTCCLILILV